MKNIINKLTIVSLAALMSCTANYENINSNPHEPGSLEADDYALGSAMNNLAGCVVSPDVNTAQFTDCLLGGPMGGYYADANAGWANTISNYNPKDDWSRVFLKSDKIIPVLNSNLATVKLVSENTGNPVPYAIANIIKVATMHRVADTFGPIPYTKMGESNNLAIPYDSQETVYNAFFEDLNSAIDILNEYPNAMLVKDADYIYAGNIKQWIKFANSLKLRLAIRIAYADLAKAKEMAEEAVAPANGGVMETNDDNAAWKYFSSSIQNPIYVATRYNQVPEADIEEGYTNTGGDTHAAADIICYMNGYGDARREKYFIKSMWKGYDYVGLRRGIIIPDLTSKGHKYSGVNISTTSPIYWMNAAEVAFLRAEGTAIFGFNMGGTAEAFYNEGIRLSFDQWDASGADAYLSDATSKPEAYTDPAGDNTYTSGLSSITIKWNEGASKEEKQERIIVQKWIANWQLGNEAWADFRRTGYPKLIPATAAGNKSGGIVDSNKGARRMPYPLDEYNSNSENITEAVSKYLKGPDNMATDLWWAAKK
ncbi:RagB/SusD family nutrient uptake outer membrane protein [Dysgonomonas sp. 511]|uniref:RagB/SusD family nutrient uptake outer membrane protein n=1 Tax=Dysgonomonas sp. 511 TaxID=2302930 RepID=UPI0013D5BE1E|nr:RagB/SusD family nutrient uptake outer membrane protein [Dysgonomonas sp. 511]NDV79304.1 SusD/RagB family nutrient-binding outer membrane lipoprotein [Dysgonomonas sp. 511]